MAFTQLPCSDEMDITGRVPGRLNQEGTGVRVSPAWWATHFPVRAQELIHHDARFHPRRHIHDAPAGIRAIAHAHDNPECVVSGVSALALFGLPVLADSCDATVNTSAGDGDREWGLVRRRRKAKRTWTVRWRGTNIQLSQPTDAVVEALQDIRDGIHGWAAPTWVSDAQLLWAVQLVDAARRHLGVSEPAILRAARGRVNRLWVRKVLALSSQLADSPKETEMRLMCTALVKDPRLAGAAEWAQLCVKLRPAGLAFIEQVPLFDGERLITTFDLALADLKIALMYDGGHHLSRNQRDKDFRISLECQLQGWTVVRVSAGTLEQLPWVLFRLLKSRGVVG